MKVHTIQCSNFGGFAHIVCNLDSRSAFFTGANGAGKTTLLDALNTAFNLGGGESKYNAAGNDAKSSRGATTRNLASYILGSADDGRLREHGAIGHVFATLAMEPCDKAGGFLHVGCIAQARMSPGGHPELVGHAHGVCWASDSPEIPRHLIFGLNEHGVESPRSHRDFGVQCKADGLSSQVASTIAKTEHMAFVAKHALGRHPSPEQAKTLCLAMASTIKIDPDWTPNGFAKKLLSSHGAAFNAQSVANLGEAANAFEAASQALRVGQDFHDSIQRVDDKASDAALRAQEHAAALVDCAQREATQAQQHLDGATAKQAALIDAKGAAQNRLRQARDVIETQKNSLDALVPQINDARAGLGLRGLEELQRLAFERRESAQKLFDVQASSWSRERALIGKWAAALTFTHPALAQPVASWAGTARPVEGLDEALNALAQLASEDSLGPLCQDEAADALAQARREEARARAAFDRLSSAPQGQANAPQIVRDAIVLINQSLPGARARCLCDVATPAAGSQREWVDAFERVMGPARFAIVVDEGHEYDAQRIAQRAASGQGFSVEVARNDKCGKAVPRAVAFKALDLLDFGSDHQARAFAETRFGMWQMCLDGDLRSLTQAFCLDGRTSSSHTLRASGQAKSFQPCFGAAAASTARAVAQADLNHARALLATTQAARAAVDAAANARRALIEIEAAAMASRWGESWADLGRAKQAADEQTQALARACADQANDGSSQRVERLETSLRDAKAALARAELEKDAASADAIRAETLLESCEAALDSAEHARNQRQAEALRRAIEASAWAQATGISSKTAPPTRPPRRWLDALKPAKRPRPPRAPLGSRRPADTTTTAGPLSLTRCRPRRTLPLPLSDSSPLASSFPKPWPKPPANATRRPKSAWSICASALKTWSAPTCATRRSTPWRR